MKKHHFFIVLILALFILAGMIFRPVPIPSDEKNCLRVEGIVKEIYEGGIKDVVFRLEGNQTKYYINRGLENGLTLEGLKEELIDNYVVILYPDYWTPLDYNNSIKHLTILRLGDRDIYNEIKLVHS